MHTFFKIIFKFCIYHKIFRRKKEKWPYFLDDYHKICYYLFIIPILIFKAI